MSAGVLVAALATAVASLVPAPGRLSGLDVAGAQTDGAMEGRFVEPVFDEVTVTEDIRYGEAVNSAGQLQDLRLDVYEPAGDTAATRPVVVLLHGGYFTMGDHRSDAFGAGPGVARTFVEMGYVVVSPQYRLRPELPFGPGVEADDLGPEVLVELEAAYLDAYDDITEAIGWLRDHAADHRVDPRAIVPFGFSSGGAIAWALAWMPGSPARPQAVDVPAAVSVAGRPVDTSLATGEALAAATAGDAPVLAYHGTADTTVPYADAAEPCARASSVGVRCEMVSYEGVGHPAIDPRFVPLFSADAARTNAFLAQEVLVPLGHLAAVPPPSVPGAPATLPPGVLVPPVPPVARPARPVVGTPSYTG